MDKGDNCGIFSRGKYSIFFWDEDNKLKHIDHSPNCRIPLMLVNEGEDQFEVFLATHSDTFSDNEQDGSALLQVDLNSQSPDDDPALMYKNNDKRAGARKGTEVDQQSTKVLPTSLREPIFPEGMIVRATTKGNTRICIVDKVILTGSGLPRYKIRPSNGTKLCTVSEKNLKHIYLEPADIPLKPSDVDNQIMTHCLSPKDIENV